MKFLREGENFRGILNDLKRRPIDAAKELGVPIDTINKVIRGEIQIPMGFIERAEKAGWPISARDFHLLRDDAPEGVKVMSSKESEESSRIMERAGKPYYEYRDTATTSNAFFRPEWIKELCIVDNNDPENPNVQWNNGHFMHQFTYFIGHVNFYYRDEHGKKQVAVMNTGDSMYITPFVPHTFTTRKNQEGKLGLILALTYGNKIIGDTQQEFSAIGKELAKNFVLDVSTRKSYFLSLFNFYMGSGSISPEELATRTGFSDEIIKSFLEGVTIPRDSEIEVLARALRVNKRDLLPPDTIEERVIIQNYQDAKRWHVPTNGRSYLLTELTHTSNLPNSRALELDVLKANSETLSVGLHQYGYNLSDKPVVLEWNYNGTKGSKKIDPGDSFYIKPFIRHRYLGEGGKLLILRIGGRVVGEPQRELSTLGQEGALRALGENEMWFNQRGRNKI